ncbi:MAG TPA: ABC transporter substrate-binding protein [Micrococcaceae bacterium]|nr:ABC transporter substrate-binding protein [Micrococcaceae bacterium]
MKHARAVIAASVATIVLGATACGSMTGNARTASVQASGDGVLKVGLLLDSSGTQDFINSSERAAAKLAVKQINATGGLKGKPVELLPDQPGTDVKSQANTLAAAGADVVIGPTDSSNATAALDVLSRSRITLISPANTAAALSDAKSGGYYFRTQARDTLQAQVLAKLAAGIGKSVAVLHQDGSYGSEVGDAVTAALKASGAGISANEEVKSSAPAEAVAKVKAAAPDAVIVVARDGGQAILAELADAGIPGSKLVLSDGVTGEYGTGLAADALKGAKGILPGVFPTAAFQSQLLTVSPDLKDMTYAPETYDAVMLAALAATAADDDAGASIASQLIPVSGGTVTGMEAGVPCNGYPDCSALLKEKKRIDYDGLSGPVNFDANGDITTGNYVVFTYGPDNKAAMTGTEKATKPSS